MKLRLSHRAIFFSLTLLLVTCKFSHQPLDADCLVCWELKSVESKLNDKSVLEGYVTWNDAWYGTYDEKFPGVLFDKKDQVKNVSYYSDIRTILVKG